MPCPQTTYLIPYTPHPTPCTPTPPYLPQLMCAARFHILSITEWEVAKADKFRFSLPVEVNWDYYDNKLLPVGVQYLYNTVLNIFIYWLLAAGGGQLGLLRQQSAAGGFTKKY